MGRIVKPFVVLATLVAALNPAQAQQDRRVRVDVQHYVIDAEINPETQTIAATAQVRFVPQDATSSVSFDLNNALNVSRIVDGRGGQVPAARSHRVSVMWSGSWRGPASCGLTCAAETQWTAMSSC